MIVKSAHPVTHPRLVRGVVFELARVNLENIWLATFQHRPWAFTLANYSSAEVTDPFNHRATRVRAKGTQREGAGGSRKIQR